MLGKWTCNFQRLFISDHMYIITFQQYKYACHLVKEWLNTIVSQTHTIVIVYNCFKELTVLSRITISPPPSTVSTVLAKRLGVMASKSCTLDKKTRFKHFLSLHNINAAIMNSCTIITLMTTFMKRFPLKNYINCVIVLQIPIPWCILNTS